MDIDRHDTDAFKDEEWERLEEEPDEDACRQKLLLYQRKHFVDTAVFDVKVLRESLVQLTQHVNFDRSPSRPRMERLLASYLEFMGNMARDHQRFARAIHYFDKGLNVTAHNHQALEATLLVRRGGAWNSWARVALLRGEQDKAQSYFASSIRDHDAACALDRWLPPHVKGAAIAAQAAAHACTVNDQSELDDALRWMDQAEQLLDAPISEESIYRGGNSYLLSFDKERFYLNKAAALLDCVIKDLRAPSRALDALAQLPAESLSRRIQTASLLLQARAHFELNDYPLSATLAGQALALARQTRDDSHIIGIDALCRELSATRANKLLEVARLKVGILEANNPEFFAAGYGDEDDDD
ncbi:hypothetical protein EPA93_04285 [Ktedonosporobacter rubrisoli]|uniref:Tetratricopeptide repeat protein n=1 Tax=Ktedonosporobacter rubrisoli TaxID=2509675 RepID=A0A4P6JJG7_KTERU|nr:hypothetical protein [Ktedonosporobacter rubrisoli]QBD75254.1 hypothetical protein EPA93_04285 [Ktedonosporobacter rubrisoli]